MQKEFRRKTDLAIAGVIIALLLHFAGILWWTSKLDSRVVFLEKWTNANSALPLSIVRIETRFDALMDQIKRLNLQIEKNSSKLDELRNSR